LSAQKLQKTPDEVADVAAQLERLQTRHQTLRTQEQAQRAKLAKLESREQELIAQLAKEKETPVPLPGDAAQDAQLAAATQAAKAVQKSLQEHQAKAAQEQEQLPKALADMEVHQSELQRQLDTRKRPASEQESSGKCPAAAAASAAAAAPADAAWHADEEDESL
jgi:chromosome segregation ATPase